VVKAAEDEEMNVGLQHLQKVVTDMVCGMMLEAVDDKNVYGSKNISL